MRWHLARLLPYAFFLFIYTAEGKEEKWNLQCPKACSCQLSHFKDLPMRRWLAEGLTGQESTVQQTYEYNNEAMYGEETASKTDDGDDGVMKMAICIFQKGYDAEEILSSLPSNLEVLTILQSPDSGHINLGKNAFQNIPDLVALEIQGFHKSGSQQTSGHHSNRVLAHLMLTDEESTEEDHLQLQNKITILNDALQSLTSLHYLNLQYVKLQGGGRKFHGDSRPKPIISDSYKYNVEEDNLRLNIHGHKEHMLHKLVFLAPDPEGEVLSYRNYNEQLEHSAIYMFSGMSNLVFLRIYGCELKQVNWEMFDGLTGLAYLSLENNDLKFIPEFTFYGTPNLQVVSLAYNKLLSLQSTSLAGLLELKKLDLSHNNFSHLSELSLPPFPHLKTADFRYNPIETVFSSTFEIMNATETLYLGDDESEIEIRPKSFLGLRSLLKLVIHNVRIMTLENTILTGMAKLKELEMQGFIESMEFDAFVEVPKLEKLTLRNCQLKTISMDSFYGLYNLLYLDLSNNLLESLPPGIFDQQLVLKELLLQNNSFQELPENIFSQIPAKMIRLEGNPWHCTCSMMSWRETVINKEKQRIAPVCQFQHDKGSSCHQITFRYVYDKRVAPVCETPVKYREWSVFYVLRKVLRCKKNRWNVGEIKQTKYLERVQEYIKNRKNLLEDKQKNKTITSVKDENQGSISLTDSLKANDTFNSTNVGNQPSNMTEFENGSKNEESGPITVRLKNDTEEINPKRDYTTPPHISEITRQVTPEEISYLSSANNKYTTDDTILDSTIERNTETQNLRSNSTTVLPSQTEFIKIDKGEEQKETSKENSSENHEINDLHSFMFAQKTMGELNNLLPNNRLLKKMDNLFVSENSNKFNIPVNVKNSHHPAQISRPSEEEHIILHGNKKIKISKKAFKLEKERQKEKLKTK